MVRFPNSHLFRRFFNFCRSRDRDRSPKERNRDKDGREKRRRRSHSRERRSKDRDRSKRHNRDDDRQYDDERQYEKEKERDRKRDREQEELREKEMERQRLREIAMELKAAQFVLDLPAPAPVPLMSLTPMYQPEPPPPPKPEVSQAFLEAVAASQRIAASKNFAEIFNCTNSNDSASNGPTPIEDSNNATSNNSTYKNGHLRLCRSPFTHTFCSTDGTEREARQRKKRSRWGGSENDKTFIPGMPTILPASLDSHQQEAYLGNCTHFFTIYFVFCFAQTLFVKRKYINTNTINFNSTQSSRSMNNNMSIFVQF